MVLISYVRALAMATAVTAIAGRDRFNAQHTSALEFEVFGHILIISQDPNSKHPGTTVWDSSMVFAKFLERNCRRGPFSAANLNGKRAVELGAGCGIAGLAMALLGCNVLMTDQAEVLPLLQKNVERNISRIKLAMPAECCLGKVEVTELKWGNIDHISAVEPPFDYVIGTDIVYSHHELDPLLQTVVAMSGPKSIVVFAYEFRSPDLTERLQSACRAHRFQIKRIPSKKMDLKFQHAGIEILVLRRQ